MSNSRRFTPFRQVLVPVVHGVDPDSALTAARAITEDNRIILVGLCRMVADQSLSAGSLRARQVRAQIGDLVAATELRRRARVRVSHEPWEELVQLIGSIQPDLLVLGWPSTLEALGIEASEVLARPPCDIVLVRGTLVPAPAHILLSVRGGPQAGLENLASHTVLHQQRPRQSGTRLLDRGRIRGIPGAYKLDRLPMPLVHGLLKLRRQYVQPLKARNKRSAQIAIGWQAGRLAYQLVEGLRFVFFAQLPVDVSQAHGDLLPLHRGHQRAVAGQGFRLAQDRLGGVHPLRRMKPSAASSDDCARMVSGMVGLSAARSFIC